MGKKSNVVFFFLIVFVIALVGCNRYSASNKCKMTPRKVNRATQIK